MLPLFYLLPLLIYFPRLISGVETQPFIMLIFSCWILLKNPSRRPCILYFFLLVMVIFLVLLRIGVTLDVDGSLLLFQLLIGPIFFFAAVAVNAPPPSRLTFAILVAIMLCAAILEIAFPSLYESLGNMVLDRVTVFDGHRGISLFTPEPTYAAISLTYIFLLALWSGEYSGRKYPWIEWILVLLLILTFSSYSIILLAVIFFAYWPRLFMAIFFVSLITLPILLTVDMDNIKLIRAFAAVTAIYTSDFSNFLQSISQIDPSIGSRLLTNFASFETPSFSLLGLGLGCNSVPTAFDSLGYYFALSNEVLAQVYAGGCIKPQSYGAASALGLGFMVLPFLIYLLIAMPASLYVRQRRPLWRVALWCGLLMLIIQSQLSSPIPWMLIFFSIARYSPPLPLISSDII